MDETEPLMTNKVAANVLRGIMESYSHMIVPRGSSKSIGLQLLIRLNALSKAVDLLEKTPD